MEARRGGERRYRRYVVPNSNASTLTPLTPPSLDTLYCPMCGDIFSDWLLVHHLVEDHQEATRWLCRSVKALGRHNRTRPDWRT